MSPKDREYLEFIIENNPLLNSDVVPLDDGDAYSSDYSGGSTRLTERGYPLRWGRVIRQVMEVDEQTLARWEALEKVRDERWDKGLEYMKERQRIVDTTQGEERERILGELRLKYFGNDAVTVASEEKAGYFRFKVRRVYGLN